MIRFDHVSMVYPRTSRAALDDVSATIERGEFAFVVGSSGSGKSTLLRLVLKEEDATAGRVQVAGRELDRLSRREVPGLRREIGCVFQDFRLLATKTVQDNVAFALQVVGASPRTVRRSVDETLEMVGLTGLGRRLPHELAGGEQQRVAIARAIVGRPSILLADEPTGNLDPATSLDILDLLHQINVGGTTVLMATHDDEIVDALRTRVLELDEGRLVRDDAQGTYHLTRPVGLRGVDHDRERWRRDDPPVSGGATVAGADREEQGR